MSLLELWRRDRVAKAHRNERRGIAKRFNDRYCFRVQYVTDAERLIGTALGPLMPRGGNRWMCPDCNRIHAPTECSIFSGLQYPECCSAEAGHRLSHGIRTR